MIDAFHIFQCFPYFFHEIGKNKKTNFVCLFSKIRDIIINKNNIYIYFPRMEKREAFIILSNVFHSVSLIFSKMWKIGKYYPFLRRWIMFPTMENTWKTLRKYGLECKL